jgi:tryptophan halogenase
MSKIKNIVIVGGGSAGWMTASTICTQFKDINVTVIESPNYPTVGVGESTIGGINDWINLIGIKRKDFMKHTDASFKLSIRFTDFYKKNSGSFHYPFGTPVQDKSIWYSKKIINPSLHVSDYAESVYPNMALVTENKITKDDVLQGFLFDRDTAFHFDATKFGLWLKDNVCLSNGVNHIVSEVKEVSINDDGIETLFLENGKYISADLFIDCTGFRSFLLGDKLKEPFNSYEHLLPNNSAWATQVPYTDKEKELVGYTDCHAIDNGWVWNIPLWSRIGTGYVYSDKYVSDENALIEFKNHLISKGYDISSCKFKNIKMRVGIHERLWVKNVCAIGLSSGFIEPLESTGLFTVHEFLTVLVRQLSRSADRTISQFDKDTYNLICKNKFKGLAQFVSMHYALSHRDDTPYWRSVLSRDYKIEEEYRSIVDNFINSIEQRFLHKNYNNDWAGIHCIATGLNCLPIDNITSKMGDYHGDNNTIHSDMASFLDHRKDIWLQDVKPLPSLYSFLEKYRV